MTLQELLKDSPKLHRVGTEPVSYRLADRALHLIDWYYTADKLRVGGMVMIDDTQLWTGHALKRFLIQEPEWELVEDVSARTAIFMKPKEYNHEKWWGQQAYVVQNSKRLIRVSEVRQGLEMLGWGEFRKLIEKVSATIRK
jgi:hypothetical protein